MAETHRRSRRYVLWLAWFGVVALACMGLPRYRIDNDIRRWTPHLAGQDSAASMVIVGFDRSELDASELAQMLDASAHVSGVLPVTGDGRMDGLLVMPGRNIDGRDHLADVRDLLSPEQSRIVLAGPAVFSQALDDWSQRGLPLASGLIVVVGTLTLFLTTRRLRPTLEGLFAVFSSQLVLVGWIGWHNRPMDMMLSMTPPLMMALGYSFAAHRSMRCGVNRALLLSMVTTCLGLLSFAFTDFAPIHSFAIWGATGIVTTWGAVMLLVTPPTLMKMEMQHISEQDLPASDSHWTRGRAIGTTCVGMLVTIGGLCLVTRLHIEQDVLSYFPPTSEISQNYRLLNDELIGMLPFEVVVTGNADPTVMLTETLGVRKVVSMTSPAGTPQQHYLGFADDNALPQLAAAQTDWQSWADDNEVGLRWEGVAAQMEHIGRSVLQTAYWAVPAMVLIAGIAAWLIDHRWSSALLSIYVNLFPVAVLIGAIVIANHPVDLATLVISSLAIGVAIDDTLHLLLARQSCGSMVEAVRVCRQPCLGSSLAVALCMSMFTLCPFRPTAEFGLLVALVVVIAAVSDLVLLPAAAIALGERHEVSSAPPVRATAA